MIPKVFQQHVPFPFQKIVQDRIFTLDIPPQRQLNLIIDTFYIGSLQRSTRRSERMTAIMINTVLFSHAEYTLPGRYIHRTVTGQGKNTGIMFPTQKSFITIYHKLRTLHFKLAHTEIYHSAIPVFPGTERNVQFVKCGMKFTPQ
ncbi:Uncharacterised protein [uncultured Bacteroides sp.]|nr:Uncharacterised protein [uncultured Bacteroides sp.]